ncbi:TerD family protein [Cellulomonas fimi]|uniref:TerD family protein n=1 Tax=Cellulomonas fimi TaxID=1708 RepID=UPI002358318D|nr:TerD family protein [Cellulomonas fimi]
MAETALTKGANCALAAETTDVRVVVAWNDTEGGVDVDASALLLGDQGRVRSDDDLVFFNQPASADGAVRLLGRTTDDAGSRELVGIQLHALPEDVSAVAITASLSDGAFGSLDGLHLRVLDEEGTVVVHYEITDATTETAFLFGEVYRRGDGWKVRAVGQGWDTGLAGLAAHFGVSVDQEPETEPEALPLTHDDLPDAAPTDDADELVDVVEPTTTSAQPVVASAVIDDDATDDVAAALRPRRSSGVRTSKRAAAPVQPPRLRLAGAETWQAARLFSISGVGTAEEQEKRATSALLATMTAVPAFGRALTSRFGAPAGAVETYLEVPFTLGESTVYPDGVLRVARGAKRWTALVEVKTGSGQLRREQVEHYLDVARQEGYDTLVTLSNDIAPQPGEHPVVVDRRKLRKVTITHLSWAEVLHEATFTLNHRGVGDALQAWILAELIRYLEHPRSGAGTFDDMGPAWVPVREAIHAGTLRATDRKVPAVADTWTRLVRQVCLRLGSDLGVTVTQSMPRRLATDSAARIQAIVGRLAADGVLEAVLKVPQAAGPLTITADLRTSQVRIGIDLDAPQEGTAQRRISWLVRQLKDAPDAVLVEARFAGRPDTACERLADVRANASVLLPDRSAEITAFRLTLASVMGTKRSGIRGAFVPSVTTAVEAFYSSVVQSLRPWQPAAPKLPEEVRAEAIDDVDIADVNVDADG